MRQDFVPQASTFKLYTPSASVLPYKYCTFFLTADSTVSFVDKDGNTSTLVSLKAGYQPILVQKITAVTSGSVYIMTHSQLN